MNCPGDTPHCHHTCLGVVCTMECGGYVRMDQDTMTDREQIEALSKQVEALTAEVCELKGVLAALEVEDITSLLEDIRFMRDNPPMSEGLWCAFCERQVKAVGPFLGPHAPEPLPAEPHEAWCPTPHLTKLAAVFEKLAEVNA